MVQIAARPDRRREILAAASRVFRSKGLAATGMRDIAAELGMAVGNLYYYFDGKGALLAWCQEDALAGLDRLAARVAALEGGADTRLWALVAGHVVRLHEGTPGSLAHLEVEAIDAGPRKDAILARRRSYERFVRRLVAEGVEAGVFARPGIRLDPRVQALVLLGAVNWTVKWFRPEGGRDARRLGEELADSLVGGLLAPGRRLCRPSAEALAALHEDPEDSRPLSGAEPPTRARGPRPVPASATVAAP